MIRRSDGFALIDILFVCGILSILSTIALPRLLLAKQSAGAASAIGSMRVINSGQLTFALTCGAGFYAPNLTALGRAPIGSNEAFISPSLSGGNTVNHSGYMIQVEGTPFAGSPGSCNGLAAGATARGFKAGADPLEPTNTRYFATNSNGEIFEDSAAFYATVPELGVPPTGHLLR